MVTRHAEMHATLREVAAAAVAKAKRDEGMREPTIARDPTYSRSELAADA
jgi:hypothetical protein